MKNSNHIALGGNPSLLDLAQNLAQVGNIIGTSFKFVLDRSKFGRLLGLKKADLSV
jgi:hypothetical protein